MKDEVLSKKLSRCDALRRNRSTVSINNDKNINIEISLNIAYLGDA
ncbi:hypothetical protein [Pseudomonas izuensis]|nr:hypothetical protein [Pseudomonas izuensis]